MIEATELELDTDPRWLLADFEERGVAQNTAVATELEVTMGAMKAALHICYDAADLERILPHLQDGAQATQSLEPAPEPRPALVKATPETGYIIENMIPLHHHDQPPEVSFRTNRHGVPMLDPRAKRGKWEINTCIGNHEQQDMFHRVLSGYLPGEYRAGLGMGSLYGTSMMLPIQQR